MVDVYRDDGEIVAPRDMGEERYAVPCINPTLHKLLTQLAKTVVLNTHAPSANTKLVVTQIFINIDGLGFCP